MAGLNSRPTSYISVMSYLITGAEGATQKELATLMGADAPTVVRVLDVLEREGIVEELAQLQRFVERVYQGRPRPRGLQIEASLFERARPASPRWVEELWG